FASDIASHRLRREIITRVVVNDLVNRGGPSFVSRLQDDTGRSVRDIVRAFAMVREGFALPELYREIDALDNAIDGRLQLDLYAGVARLVLTATGWCLRNGDGASSLDEQIVALRNVRKVLEPRLAALLPGLSKDSLDARRLELSEAGVPKKLAERLAALDIAAFIPDTALAARSAGVDPIVAAKAFFAVTDAFRIGRIESAAAAIATSDYYEYMALSRAVQTIGSARSGITIAALA